MARRCGGKGVGLKVVFGLMLILLLASLLYPVFIMPVVVGSGTIYNRADGSIDPPTAPIQQEIDTYSFADNIYNLIVDKMGDNR